MSVVAQAAFDAGFRGDALRTAVAVALGESGGNPAAIGDQGLQDSVWGPSVGLWQIRSLKSERGTGSFRDADALRDAGFNARAAWQISSQGTNFRPWSVYTNGSYIQLLDDAADLITSIGKVTPMVWMPGAAIIDRGGSIPVQDNGPVVVVLHTTETDGPASYNGTEPHFEVSMDVGIKQFISLSRTAKALYNGPGGTETNRRKGRIWQIEIVWRAANSANMPDKLLFLVAEVITFLRSERPDLRLVGPPQGIWAPGTIAVEDSPLRFSFSAWENFGGICGHVNVPENDHWDPGRIDLERLFTFVRQLEGDNITGGKPVNHLRSYAAPDNPKVPDDGGLWVTDGITKWRVPGPQEAELLNAIGIERDDRWAALHNALL